MNIYYLKRMRRRYEYFHTAEGWWFKNKKTGYSCGPMSTVRAMDWMLGRIAGFVTTIEWHMRVLKRLRLVEYKKAAKNQKS